MELWSTVSSTVTYKIIHKLSYGRHRLGKPQAGGINLALITINLALISNLALNTQDMSLFAWGTVLAAGTRIKHK